MKDIFSFSTTLLFHNNCESCNTPLLKQEEKLCLHCYTELPFTHQSNNTIMGLKFAGRVPFQDISAFLYFYKDSKLQELLHKIKYKQNKSLALYLGHQWGIALQNQGLLHHIDGIVPVPLHQSKEHKRGFNQSLMLAQGIAQSSGIQVIHQSLIRIKNTDSQTKKTRSERLENMKGVFQTQNTKHITHKHLLLIDDVFTTGATLESSASALLKIDGVTISIASLAVAMD